MQLEYPSKIVLAWGEAIGGNSEIRDWLIQNGYPELGLFCFALRNQDDARQWLIDNGHPHLMALINGSEGNPQAILWLRKFHLDIVEKMARAADNDDRAHEWLLLNGHKEMAMIAQKMRYIKNQIESDNNDMHKISPH